MCRRGERLDEARVVVAHVANARVDRPTRQRRRSNALRKAGRLSMLSALALMLAKPTVMSFAQFGTRPQRITSRLRCSALGSYRTIGRGSVGATFQFAGKFGVGRSGGIEKTNLISLTSEERRTRPHMTVKVASPAGRAIL